MPAAAKDRRSRAPKAPKKRSFTAATADKHELYQLSVQNVEAEIDFVDQTYKELRGRHAVRLREDFCGTGNTACEWVRRRASNVAVGLDLDQPTLDWGHEHNVLGLKPEQRRRVSLLNRDVRRPGDAVNFDVVLAMNFSYWLFRERAALIGYFSTVRRSLADRGVFFLDHYGGYESMQVVKEPREIDGPGHETFTYVWEQASYNPINADMECHIHFRFADKTRMNRAFSYQWRLWTLPEIRECLAEAGFRNVTVYWEGDELDKHGEPTGEGDGVFLPRTVGEPDPAFITYLTAEK